MYFENENLDSMDSAAEAYITLAGAVAQEESSLKQRSRGKAIKKSMANKSFTNQWRR